MSSPMGAVQTKYDSLTASSFPGSAIPPRFMGRAPELWNGTQLYPPYVVIDLVAAEELLTFESDSIEEFRLTFTAYAATQAAADQIIKAVRFDGQNPDQLAGFDCGGLPALTEGVHLACLPARPPSPAPAGKGKDGALFYKTTMEYTLSAQRT